MNTAVLPLVVLWPLLLAAMLAFASTRRAALHFVPWAAAPALLLSLLGSDSLGLPLLLLGSALQLDSTGRAFLLLAASLSLAAGLLARERFALRRGGHHFAAFFLLASSGAFVAATAGDALLFFTATTLLGYSLYGMVAIELRGAGIIGRVFVVMLVLSDVLIFELLLVLAHEAGATTFSTLHHALLLAEYPGFTLTLMLLGFGAKLGLLGLHLWLGPLLERVSAAVQAMVLVFVFCAGLLGWLRLLPLGEVYWPDAGELLQLLAVVSLAFALIIGLVQGQTRSLLACGLMALGGLFIWLLGAVLAEPRLWQGLYGPLQDALLQAGFALAALSLLPKPEALAGAAWRRHSVNAGAWLAALLLAAAPWGMTLAPASGIPIPSQGLSAIAAVFALLAGRYLRLRCACPGAPARVLLVAALSAVLLLAVGSELFSRPLAPLWPVLILVPAGLIGWSVGGTLARTLPLGPPGVRLAALEQVVTLHLGRLLRLLDRVLPHWRKRARHLAYSVRDELALRRIEVHMERQLARWPMAMLMVLLLGLLLVWWASPL